MPSSMNVLNAVIPEKKRKNKTKSPSSEIAFDVPHTRERESQKDKEKLQKSNAASEKKIANKHLKGDSSLAGNQGITKQSQLKDH